MCQRWVEDHVYQYTRQPIGYFDQTSTARWKENKILSNVVTPFVCYWLIVVRMYAMLRNRMCHNGLLIPENTTIDGSEVIRMGWFFPLYMLYFMINFVFVCKMDVRNCMYVCTLWNHLLFMTTHSMLNDTCQRICTLIFRGVCFVVTVHVREWPCARTDTTCYRQLLIGWNHMCDQ
jgi:fucose 4-O-acetylase-like acetyltransferase